MKWCRTLVLFDKGNVVSSTDWAAVHESYVRSIASIDFPQGSGKLTLRRMKKIKVSGKKKELRNGVPYLRSRFLANIVDVEKWQPETSFDLGEERQANRVIQYPSMLPYEEPITSNFGNFDLVITAPNGTHVAIEWETGNISSSHRSMNKLAIALACAKIQAGVLIVPSRQLYEHLTDRIGNIGELSGYLSMWQGVAARVNKGLLAVTVVEHDALTDDPSVEYLPVGKDGNAEK